MRGESHHWEKIFAKGTLDALNQIFFASPDSCFSHHYCGHFTWTSSSPPSCMYNVRNLHLMSLLSESPSQPRCFLVDIATPGAYTGVPDVHEN